MNVWICLMIIFSDPKCSPSKWWQVARDLCGLRGSASTCLPPSIDRCGKIVSESNAKADLLNEVFINKNTSLAPDACVFGPLPLNVTFDVGNIYPSDVQHVLRSLPNKTSCGSDKISYPIWWRRLVKVWLALLLVYSMPHLDYGRFRMNGGKQLLNRFSREARRTGKIHLATGQFPWHPVLRVRWRRCKMPGSSSILNKICFFININQVSNRTTQPSRSYAFWSTNGTWFGRGSQCSISLFRLE